jgi:hypothetical protein
MIKLVQVNIRIAEPAADRLKRLAEQAGLKLGPFVEGLLDLYKHDSNMLQNDSNAAIKELREIVVIQNERLNRIEQAILKGLEADKAGQIEADELTGTDTKEDSSLHLSDLIPAAQFNHNKAQFNAACVELYRSGITGYQKIADILTERGFRNSVGNPYYRDGVKRAIKAAGLIK